MVFTFRTPKMQTRCGGCGSAGKLSYSKGSAVVDIACNCPVPELEVILHVPGQSEPIATCRLDRVGGLGGA